MKNMEKLNHLILAEGEATGHAHRATSGVLYNNNKGVMVLEPTEDTIITHEEHHQTPLIAEVIGGPVRVERVQEFDHAEMEARNVAD